MAGQRSALKTTLPDSLVRALERLEYEALVLLEAIALGITKPQSPDVKRERQALYKKHPILRIPTFGPKEDAIYDAEIRKGATVNQALDKIEPLAEARKRRALKSINVPAGYPRKAN
jgi:hypothetical protein